MKNICYAKLILQLNLKNQYWKNKPGSEYELDCGYVTSPGYLTASIGTHITNFIKDPYNPGFHGNIAFFTWNGIPYKDGMEPMNETLEIGVKFAF